MATIEARLQALESASKVRLIPLYLFIDEGNITIEQQQDIDAAESIGRHIKLICWLAPC